VCKRCTVYAHATLTQGRTYRGGGGAEQRKLGQQRWELLVFKNALCLCALQVSRPAFLDPESTRPLAVNSTHGLAAGAGAAAAGAQGKGPRGKAAASKDFDVSRLAPALKGQQQQ
jgi:hypothetical protein